jgi:hypothetical protein
MTDRRPGLKFLAFAVVCAVCGVWIIGQTGNYTYALFGRTNTFTAELVDGTGLPGGACASAFGQGAGSAMHQPGWERAVPGAELVPPDDPRVQPIAAVDTPPPSAPTPRSGLPATGGAGLHLALGLLISAAALRKVAHRHA